MLVLRGIGAGLVFTDRSPMQYFPQPKKKKNCLDRMAGRNSGLNWGQADTDVGSARTSFESGRFASRLIRFDMEHHG